MNKISSMDINTLDTLFNSKTRELTQIIADLQLSDVKDEQRFKHTVSGIKKQILLIPATLGEPKITSNYAETKQVQPHYNNMFGGPQTFQVVTVSFPFSGSEEIVRFRASGGSLPIKAIYQPSYKTIEVEVRVPQLDKAAVLNEANNEIETTRLLIELNNPRVEAWSTQMEQQIDTMAEQKRKELIEFYD